MDRITKFRATVLFLFFGFIVTFFGFRLYLAQVVNANPMQDSGNAFTYYEYIRAARGDILDRNGNVLVSNRASYNLSFINFVINSAADRNDQLLKLVTLCADRGIEYIDHFPVTMERPYEYTLSEYSLGWQNYFQAFMRHMGYDSDTSAPLLIKMMRSALKIPEEWTDEQARRVLGVRYEIALRNGLTDLSAYNFIEDVKEDDLAAILELNVPGLTVKYSTVREYHTSYAAHILGYVGPMSPENWEEFKNVEGYTQDALIGHEGFEYAFEDVLHGVDGTKIVTVDKDGNILEEHYEQEPITGNNVETTIDLNLQMVAEDSMRNTIEKMKDGTDSKIKEDSVEVEGMAVVVMKVKTGEILVCASYPTYDPAEFHDIYNDLVTDPMRPMVNRALNQAYPPGSTYKMVTTVAAIDSGTIGRYTEIEDKGKYTEYEKEGFAPQCLVYTKTGWYTHGVLTVEDALKVSCNYFFYWIGDHMHIDKLDAAGKGLGLGEPTGVELPEVLGQRANPETKAANHTGYDADWYVGDQIPAAIGQSEHRYTPLQLCVYTCTLANQGTRYAATFLNRVVSSDYTSLVRENAPRVMSEYPISDEAFAAYMEGMRKVTQERDGTAYNYFETYNTVSVAAKTGTADMDGQATANGAFVCFAPIEDPEIAIVIYGEKAAHGSSLSYIAKDILNAYFAQDEISDVVNFENRLG